MDVIVGAVLLGNACGASASPPVHISLTPHAGGPRRVSAATRSYAPNEQDRMTGGSLRGISSETVPEWLGWHVLALHLGTVLL